MYTMNMGVAGKFRLRVRKRDGTVTKDTGEFSNIITRGGFARLNGSASVGLSSNSSQTTSGMRAVKVGAGNSEPQVSDDSIESLVAEQSFIVNDTSNIRVFNSADPTQSYIERALEWEFGEGAAAGNIAELTVGSQGTNTIDGTNIFCRALVRDSSGNPTTITVLEDEFLGVFYTFRIYPFLGGPVSQQFTATIEGVAQQQDLLLVPKNFNSWNLTTSPLNERNSINNSRPNISTQAITNSITDDSVNGGSRADSSSRSSEYDQDAFELTVRHFLSPGQGNELFPDPIKSFVSRFHNNNFRLAIQFDPDIEKDATKSFAVSYKIKWSNYSGPP